MAVQQIYNTFWVPEMFADKAGRVDVEQVSASRPPSSYGVVIPAVAGTVISVLGACVYSDPNAAAANVLNISTDTGSTPIYTVVAPDSTTATVPNVILPLSPIPYFSSSVGSSIECTPGAAGYVIFNFTFIRWTP